MNIPSTSRLSFHFIDEEDSEFLFHLDQNPAVMKYLTGGKPTSKIDIIERFIPRLNAYRNIQKGWGLWKVTIIESKEDIGWILVRPMEFFSDNPNMNDIELGWRFVQESWGKGYASEAANHIQQVLSPLHSNQYFSAIADENNLGSIGVMKKIGMTYLKTTVHDEPQLGRTNVVHYQMEKLTYK